MNTYAGQYWNSKEEVMAEVSIENDTLHYFEPFFNWKTKAFPISDNQFMIENRPDLNLVFTTDDDRNKLALHISDREPLVFNGITQNSHSALNEYVGVFRQADLLSHFTVSAKEEFLVLENKKGFSASFKPIDKDEFGCSTGCLLYTSDAADE